MSFSFIEPMLLLAEPSLPEGWVYKLKLDAYASVHSWKLVKGLDEDTRSRRMKRR